eukprot:98782-Pyramimonas_sp.AAC.1
MGLSARKHTQMRIFPPGEHPCHKWIYYGEELSQEKGWGKGQAGRFCRIRRPINLSTTQHVNDWAQ